MNLKGGEKKTKITFVISSDAAAKLSDVFEQYIKQFEFTAPDGTEEHWWGEKIEGRSILTLKLTTGNMWTVCFDFLPTLTYQGSRAGFRKLTPLMGKAEVTEKGIILFGEEFPVSVYETTMPSLKFFEYLEPLAEMPDKAVVRGLYHEALRVIPYKNVYR
jgi:hypothetical protein